MSGKNRRRSRGGGREARRELRISQEANVIKKPYIKRNIPIYFWKNGLEKQDWELPIVLDFHGHWKGIMMSLFRWMQIYRMTRKIFRK